MMAAVTAAWLLACSLAGVQALQPGYLVNEEMYFQFLPIGRYSDGSDVSSFIQFQLYTNASTPVVNLTLGDVATLRSSTFDPRLRTLLYLHGYAESAQGRTTQQLRDAFLARGGYNVVIADYQRLVAGPWYHTAVANTPNVGRHVALFVDFLVAHGGLRLSDLHAIGISLGGQVVAVMGAAVSTGLVGRITGFDPASLGYDSWSAEQRLNKAHAQFVEVIHSDVDVYGIRDSVGHADFYPNGGRVPQPGCSIREMLDRHATFIEWVFCSHLQAIMFYLTSMRNEHAFPATPCASWADFQQGACPTPDADDVVYMGIASPSTARGDYYLSTLGVEIVNPLADDAARSAA